MAMAVADSNSTLTDGTEQTLSTQVGSNIFQFDIDISPMLNADVLEVRLKKKVLTGGVSRTIWRATVGPSVRAELILSSPPISCPFGCVVTIKRVAGTDRTYPWSLMSLQ